MDKWTVTAVLFVAIIVHEGLNHQGIELPSSQETPVLSPALREAIRIVDADLHTHKGPPSSLDQPMGHEADDAAISGDVSVPLIGQEIRSNPVRRRDVRYEAGEQPTPFPMRFL
ncbi:MAG TPA: hypothetical protein VGQ08_12380 [Nitrospiraceae bacterium]|nr:hypothetical protein [Nitrospiraceae bacterium]